MWRRPLTWSLRGCLEFGAGPGASESARAPLWRVPNCEKAFVVAVAQNTEGGNVEIELSGRLDLQTHPRDCDGSEEVAVREGEDRAVCLQGEVDELLSPFEDLPRRFASRTPVLVQLPPRLRLTNLLCRLALVLAVLDLAKQWGEPRTREAGDLSSSSRPLEWARVDGVEMKFLQTVLQ